MFKYNIGDMVECNMYWSPQKTPTYPRSIWKRSSNLVGKIGIILKRYPSQTNSCDSSDYNCFDPSNGYIIYFQIDEKEYFCFEKELKVL